MTSPRVRRPHHQDRTKQETRRPQGHRLGRTTRRSRRSSCPSRSHRRDPASRRQTCCLGRTTSRRAPRRCPPHQGRSFSPRQARRPRRDRSFSPLQRRRLLRGRTLWVRVRHRREHGGRTLGGASGGSRCLVCTGHHTGMAAEHQDATRQHKTLRYSIFLAFERGGHAAGGCSCRVAGGRGESLRCGTSTMHGTQSPGILLNLVALWPYRLQIPSSS